MPLNLTLTLSLTDEELSIIEHVVTDEPTKQSGQRVGEAWAQRAFDALGVNGPAAVAAKVNKYRADYLAAKSTALATGTPYRNAAERQADATAERNAIKQEN